MKADRTLLIAGKYYLLSAVALAVGAAIAVAGVAISGAPVSTGGVLGVLAPLLEGNLSGFLARGTGAYLVVLGGLVAVAGRTVAIVHSIGSGLEAGLDRRTEAIERDLNQELRALRADLTDGPERRGREQGRARDQSTEATTTGAGTGERPATGADDERSD